MGLKDRRSNNPQGKYSTALILPAKIAKGKESTLAANRLILVDPRGEINEDDLLEFLETYIEPQFWPWIRRKKRKNKIKHTVPNYLPIEHCQPNSKNKQPTCDNNTLEQIPSRRHSF